LSQKIPEKSPTVTEKPMSQKVPGYEGKIPGEQTVIEKPTKRDATDRSDSERYIQ
jgi:hypothetical protein